MIKRILKINFISNNQLGFTLIELLVVCSIIGILATMSVTLVSRARMNARETAALATLNSFAGAWEAYWSRNGTYPQWGQEMRFSDPHDLFMTLVRDGYLPKAYSQIPYVDSSRLFYRITEDYALEIFPFDDDDGTRHPANYYWLLLHPLGFQKDQGYLGIGTSPAGGKNAVRPRVAGYRADINRFTIYGLHHSQ
ncbi:prepilin-type N-terminal cleavage/methylation domain-containing protein [bacterium]|nr:prepilin-type N-terminal cleavage/methylation domain-containing protein [bacterium]MBU1026021.1 prepilin-type N-terminal cleavage/methylation domain-containing protein [bacterium]